MNNRLTRCDIQKMKEEIEYRTLIVRKESLEDVKTQRAHVDLSENFEYHEAKKFKNKNESRIRHLKKMIATAEIIDDDSDPEAAGVNDTLKLRYEDDQSEETIKLVTTVREDSLAGKISIESPLGSVLLKKRAGDTVTVVVNEKISYDVTILAIIKSDDESEEISSY